jgi:hypothetical protein
MQTSLSSAPRYERCDAAFRNFTEWRLEDLLADDLERG